uniref:Protein kinase domain-containing protein n=1 Tax=Kalanchoe fedtschenkoi TaxID=63787 RepID=A0A7N0V9S3_KALFE
MESEVDLPAPLPDSGLTSTAPHSATASSTLTSSSPPPFRRDIQEFFRRHRPFNKTRGTFRPSRVVARPQGSGCTSTNSDLSDVAKMIEGKVETKSAAWRKDTASMGGKARDLSITPPSALPLRSSDNSGSSCDEQGCAQKEGFTSVKEGGSAALSHGDYRRLEADYVNQKMLCSIAENASQGFHAAMDTRLSSLSPHVGTLASTDIKMTETNQVEASTVIDQDINQGVVSFKTDKRIAGIKDPSYVFGNFLNHPSTLSSVVGSSCTTTMRNSTSAPMITSTTCCSRINPDGYSNANESSYVNPQVVGCEDAAQPPRSSSKLSFGISANQEARSTSDASAAENHVVEKGSSLINEQLIRDDAPENGTGRDKSVKWKGSSDDVTDIQNHAPLAKTSTADLNPKCEKPEISGTDKGLPAAPRKRNFNSDAFFKVNGKQYQKLGRIGVGGSSEVHKVISADCSIYALKKIRLKGRDYATAFGFCQEILYLNKLKGKSNIIQLIDFEVTDKGLLQEVMMGTMSNKDSKVKDDGYIFMVLEYGEIDLAHMLSQKWKEIDGCDQTIDDNWLRFYWQQILLAVNTIHEERIVHSDLKPANFLLVRGSLKLIDFGIAKAIMSDTTNIQRDSQVGTLSYMSPEAFMCNEIDADGNTIKCGRPSDIWSLGCILYQMVYGMTPFADHKTFWAKFKVITDPNHEIKYPPLPNPWLLDLMKKCLAWDRDKRWRIPQLLEHPFLRPPIPPRPYSSCSPSRTCKLVQLISEACTTEREASTLRQHMLQLANTSVKSQLHIEEVKGSSAPPNSQSYTLTFCNN